MPKGRWRGVPKTHTCEFDSDRPLVWNRNSPGGRAADPQKLSTRLLKKILVCYGIVYSIILILHRTIFR